MSLAFLERSSELERMDIEPLDPRTVNAVLGNLETINQWLGGVRATLWHLDRFVRRRTPQAPLRLLDWGTGGADMPRAIVRWARKRRIPIQILGIDNDPAIVAYAQEACLAYPEIELLRADARDFSPAPKSFDVVHSSLTLHHLPDEAIVELLKKSDRIAQGGLIMNDLRRSVRAWAWIWTLSRLSGAHPMVQEDGPLSVRRAFTAEELQGYAKRTGLNYLKAYTHFGYRLTLAGAKPS